ncbi:NFACT RNA binding domain-containing protein [Fodinibius sp. N2]|uniref:NFACT RNA binding domain-containing protein n=1 Tax=Fodinibius alkaliphilus TaxID=3140241 RepID=UPI00315A6ADE
MNNFYTLIYLNREIKEKIEGSFFDFAISPHKDVLHIYVTDNNETSRLIFSANPRETVLFLDFYRPPKKSNVIDFFEGLEGQEIIDMRLADKDRLVSIYFDNGQHLLFKLFSGNPNVFLVEDGVIVDAFKNPGEVKGEQPPEPEAPEFLEELSPRRSAKNQMTEANPLLPRNLLPYLIEQHDVDEMSPEEVKKFTDEVSEALLEDPHPRVLKTGDFCLWSKEWLDIESEKECTEVNDCVAFGYKNAVHLRRLHEKKEEVVQFLERSESQKESLIEQLQQADKSLERSEEYEKYGHLLMAHAHEKLHDGTTEITIEDFYEGNEQITIPLKEDKSIPENAEYYYEKSKDAKKSYEHAKQRLPKVKRELGQIKELLAEIERIDHLPDMDSWIKNNINTLEEFGYGSNDDNQATSPFRKYKEGKFEIWIGKNAKSNDKLTSHAHKEDIWLHARGVGGSHVVIRMGNRKDYPPQHVLLKAASYAAYFSKAKGMQSAPVMYTKVKYVRKPKGAAPGAVVVEREEVEMVPPMKPKQ